MDLREYSVIQTSDGKQYLFLREDMMFCLGNKDHSSKEDLYCLRRLDRVALEGSEIIGKLCYTGGDKIGTPVINMKELMILLSCAREVLNSGMVDVPYKESEVTGAVAKIEQRLGEVDLVVDRE
jgi:hypothetical protein